MESKLIMSLRWKEDVDRVSRVLEAVEGGMLAHPDFPKESYERRALMDINNAIYNLQRVLRALESVSASYGLDSQTQIDLQPYPPLYTAKRKGWR